MSWGESVALGLRRRVPWFGTCGPALTLADVAAVLLVWPAELSSSWPRVLAATAVAVGVVWAAGLHRPRLLLRTRNDLPVLLVTASLVGWVQGSVLLGIAALVTLTAAHALTYGVTRTLRRSGRLGHRVLLLGTGAAARRLVLQLELRPDLGLRPVGFVSATDTESPRGLPLAWVGPVRLLPLLMAERRGNGLLLAPSGPLSADQTAAVVGCLAARCPVWATDRYLPDELPRAGPPERSTPPISFGSATVPHPWQRCTRWSTPSWRWWPCLCCSRSGSSWACWSASRHVAARSSPCRSSTWTGR